MNFTKQGTVRGWFINSIAPSPNNGWAIVSKDGRFAELSDTTFSNMTDVGLKGGWTLNMATYNRRNELWAVGNSGNVGQWLGGEWKDMGNLGGWIMGMITFDSIDNTWGVGAGGNIGKLVNMSWQDYGFPAEWKLRSIAFRPGAPEQVYCVSQNGDLGLYDISTTSLVQIPTPGWNLGNITFSQNGHVAYGISTQGELGICQLS